MQKTNLRILSLMCILCCLFTWHNVQAQQKKEIKGTVVDIKGEGLIGVSVSVKGTTVGTVTDLDGHFVLSAPADARSLEVKYIGMKDKVVPISGSVVNITMEDNSSELSEIVVIGYGTMKKNDLTGSVGSISSDNITAKGTTSAISAIRI